MKLALKITLWLFGFILILCIGGVATVYIYKDKVTEAILSAVAKRNDLSFETDGTKLVLFPGFPNCNISFDNLRINQKEDVTSNININVRAYQAVVSVNLAKFVLKKELVIDNLLLKTGFATIQQQKVRQQSFKDKESLDIWLEMKAVTLKNFIVTHIDEGKDETEVRMDKVLLSLSKKAGSLTLYASGNVELGYKAAGQKNRVFTERGQFDISFGLANDVATIEQGKISASKGAKYELSGEINLKNKTISATASGQNLKPEHFSKYINPVFEKTEVENITGHTNLSIKFNGKYTQLSSIRMQGQGNITNGKIAIKNKPSVKIKTANVIFKTNSITNYKSYGCDITDVDLIYSGFSIMGTATVSNFSTPTIDGHVVFIGNMRDLKLESIPQGDVSGTLKIRAKSFDIEGVDELSGNVEVKGLEAMLGSKTYGVDGKITVEKNIITPNVKLTTPYGDGVFTGKIQNYLRAPLDKERKTQLLIGGKVNTEKFDVDALFTPSENTEKQIPIIANIEGFAKELVLFGNIYTNSSAKIYYSNKIVLVDKLHTNGFDGQLSGNIEINSENSKSTDINCKLQFKGIEIDKVTYLNKLLNIKTGSMVGQCSGNISLSAPLTVTGLNTDLAIAKMMLEVKNGRLINFEPLKHLSSYINRDKLKDVQFSALQNTISIEKGAIIIPKMEIRSTALNTFLSGKQYFSGDFDYRVTLFLTELLSKKPQNPENPIKEGKTKLFLKISSVKGKLNVSYDPEEWGKNFSSKLTREAKEFRELSGKGKTLNPEESTKPTQKVGTIVWEEEELGETKKPTPAKKEETKKPEEIKKKPAVTIEWDE
jgi:hypothetical protein